MRRMRNHTTASCVALATASLLGAAQMAQAAETAGATSPLTPLSAGAAGEPLGTEVSATDAQQLPSPVVPTAPDLANLPSPPSAVTVVSSAPNGELSVTTVPAADPQATADALQARPGVVTASPVRKRAILAIGASGVGAPTSDGGARDMQWPLNQLGAEDAWKASAGRGAIVAILDTGVDRLHPDLAGRIVTGYDAIRGKKLRAATDGNGHGTHVAGIIAGHGVISGVAPSASIMPIRVMDSDGFGNSDAIVKGIVWAVKHRANVINMSIGSPIPDPAEQAALTWAHSNGVLIVAASGNDGTSDPTYPAAYGDYKHNRSIAKDIVIGVGALDRDGHLGSFSQRGNPVDVVAPGVAILSTYPRNKGRYAWDTGTSMASPYVAATAALGVSYLKAHHSGWSRKTVAARVDSALRMTARDLGSRGTDKRFGRGEIRPASMLTSLGARIPNAMATDLSLTGNASGRATLAFTAPPGANAVAVLTNSTGNGGAHPAITSSGGTTVWSGPTNGTRRAILLSGLSANNSYSVSLFVTRGGSTSRSVAGLRPLGWLISFPSVVKTRSSKYVTIQTKIAPLGSMPAGRITVRFVNQGRKQLSRATPLFGEKVGFRIPSKAGTVQFQATIAGGPGTWPSASRLYSLRVR